MLGLSNPNPKTVALPEWEFPQVGAQKELAHKKNKDNKDKSNCNYRDRRREGAVIKTGIGAATA
jgi:hypothetical protein